jgi:hypothetical protein
MYKPQKQRLNDRVRHEVKYGKKLRTGKRRLSNRVQREVEYRKKLRAERKRRLQYRVFHEVINRFPSVWRIKRGNESKYGYTPEKIRLLKGITIPERKYTSVRWIQDIIDKKQKGKTIDSRIRSNLIKKQNLLDIMYWLVSYSQLYDQSKQFSIAHHIGKIKMQTNVPRLLQEKDKIAKLTEEKARCPKYVYNLEERERTPIIVKLDIADIARRLTVSDILIQKYIQGMEKAGFVQRLPNVTKQNPVMGAYRIVGGYVVHNREQFVGEYSYKFQSKTPIYFWARTQTKIKERLSQFSLR